MPTTLHRIRRGFTLLELLVSIAILAVLISFVIVAVKGVAGAAGTTASLNALRNIQAGYNSYSVDANSVLMPGFVDDVMMDQLDLTAELSTNVDLSAPPFCNSQYCDGSSYVWRLAPYLNGNWEVFYEDYQDDALLSELNTEFGVGSDSDVYGLASVINGQIGIGAGTAYGLNSIFFGGDNYHGGDTLTSLNPFENPGNKIAATRLSEVRNAGRAIVFGATKLHEDYSLPGNPQISDIELGYVELRPPFVIPDGSGGWGTPQWEFDENNEITTLGGSFWDRRGGVPVARDGSQNVPVSHIDGSTELLLLGELGPNPTSTGGTSTFMRRWSPFATGFDG